MESHSETKIALSRAQTSTKAKQYYESDKIHPLIQTKTSPFLQQNWA